LASTPQPNQLITQFMAVGNGGGGGTGGGNQAAAEGEFAVFTAPQAGLLTIRATAATAVMPPVEVYDASRLPVAISHDGVDIRIPVSAQNSYYVFTRLGKSSGLEISFSTQPPADSSVLFGTNPQNPLDANHDGFVTPLDSLAVINWLNSPNNRATLQAEMVLDTNQDGHITPLDALVIINSLNSPTASSEGADTTANTTVGLDRPLGSLATLHGAFLHSTTLVVWDGSQVMDPDEEDRIEALDALFASDDWFAS
jgi:hypothetical protein